MPFFQVVRLLLLLLLSILSISNWRSTYTKEVKRERRHVFSGRTSGLRVLLQASPGPEDYVGKALKHYYTNAQLERHMKEFAARCSGVARMSSIGKSVRGAPLWVLELSNKPGQAEAKPNFKYVANMHGDETGGRQLLLALAEWLCANYNTSSTARRVLDEMHLYLMPTMNPDGYAEGMRENANSADLNRNFPNPVAWDPSAALLPRGTEEPETKAVMAWSRAKQFVAAANLHEGELVVNYPWDWSEYGDGYYNATQDDATFQYLSRVYSQYNRPMAMSWSFRDGITNGAHWYIISGGMQDWSYGAAGCFEVTLELEERKGGANLRQLFNDNLDSLLQYALTSTLGGVRGRVYKRGTKNQLQPLVANITVAGSSTITYSKSRFGDYYRPLAPGRYTLQVAAAGFAPKTINVTVPTSRKGVVKNFVFP